jgi:hypothetical protein
MRLDGFAQGARYSTFPQLSQASSGVSRTGALSGQWDMIEPPQQAQGSGEPIQAVIRAVKGASQKAQVLWGSPSRIPDEAWPWAMD